MIIIILNIKYGSTHYNTLTMGVRSNYHGYFFQCIQSQRSKMLDTFLLAVYTLAVIEVDDTKISYKDSETGNQDHLKVKFKKLDSEQWQ